MKKIKIFNLLGALLMSTLLIGIFIQTSSLTKKVANVSADVTTDKYIPFNASNFTVSDNPYDDAGSWVTGRFGTFWTHRYFNALDDFYDGFKNEGWTGTVTSRAWTHTGGYITFTLGGNPLDGGNLANYVVIKDGDNNTVASISNTAFSDPSLSENMIVKVVEISSSYVDSTLHLEIIDGKTGGFGGVTFGALKVNQTATEVARTIKTHQVHLARIDTDANDANKNTVARTATLNAYSNDSRYDAFEAVTLNSVDEDFETNGLTNWGYDIDYSQTASDNSDKYFVDCSAGVSGDTTFWGEEIPFNKTGTNFYNGWNGAPAESAKYRFLSAPMTISGTGIMSVKMGGRTSELQLLDPDDLIVLASFRNPSFADLGVSKIVSTGSRLATMTRIVIDASYYVDEEVIIALADAELGGNWGVAFFDELVTHYDALPPFKLDSIAHQGEYGVIDDMLMDGDDDDIADAYDYVQGFYADLRASGSNYSYCGLLSSNTSLIESKLDDFDALSLAAQAIVEDSQDYSHGLVASEDNYLANEVELTTVGASLAYMRATLGDGSSSSSDIKLVNTQSNIALIVLFVVSMLMLATFVTIKKTKKE